MKTCIALLLSFLSLAAFSQIKVIHFNAHWNKANDVEWFDKLSDANKKTLSIDDEAIIIFDEGEEVKRFKADLSFKMVATREEIQEYIDELIISKF